MNKNSIDWQMSIFKRFWFIGVIYLIVFIACLGSGEWYGILTVLSAGFFIAMVIFADYYFLKYKREKKVFGELTAKGIAEVLKCEGYFPQIDSDDYISFKANGYLYAIYYNAPKMALLFIFNLKEKNYSIVLQAAAKVMDKLIMSKISVIKSPDNPLEILVTFSVETLIHYIDELKENFAIYFSIINETGYIFSNELKQIEEKTQPQNAEISQTNTPKNVIVN